MTVDGFVEISTHEVLTKSFFIIAVLASNGLYCRFSYPHHAVLLQSGIQFAELHERTTLRLPDQDVQHAPMVVFEEG